MVLLLRLQDLVHLAHGGAHLGQGIHKVEGRHDGGRHAQGQDDDREEGLDAQAPVEVEDPAQGQNGEHLGGEEGVGHGHPKLAPAHPVVVVLGVGPDLVCEAGVGALALVEGLDDLNAVGVLDHGAAHLIGCLDGPGEVLGIAAHHHHHEGKGDGEHRQGQQRQPPVQHKEVDKGQQRGCEVGSHLREEVGQGGLHAVHLVHDGLLQLAAGGIHHRAQGQLRELLKQLLADGFQDLEGGLVGEGQGAVVERRPHKIADEGRRQPGRVGRQGRLACHQPHDDLRCREVGHHAAHHADDCQDHRRDESAVLVFAQLPDALDRTLLCHTGSLL